MIIKKLINLLLYLDGFTSGSVPAYSQPQYGMQFNYYDKQNLFASANQAELASSAPKTDKANLGEVSTTLPLVTYAPNSAHAMRANDRPSTVRPSSAHTMLLNNPLS